jgi:hypothetical protein
MIEETAPDISPKMSTVFFMPFSRESKGKDKRTIPHQSAFLSSPFRVILAVEEKNHSFK